MDKSIENLLTEIERRSKKDYRKSHRRFSLRELLITMRIFVYKKGHGNKWEADRKIVKLLSQEIFEKGRTTIRFQDKFYDYLDSLKARKSKDEFEYLISMMKNIMIK